MIKLSELFDVYYGNKFDLNKMKALPQSEGGIHFVGRSSENQGISASVAPVKGTEPFEAGLITVALGGSRLLSSFVQQSPFYTAQNVAVLKPKLPMSFAEKLFVCMCIRHNRFRYSAFGREANRTIKGLQIPELSQFPSWVRGAADGLDSLIAPLIDEKVPAIKPTTWKAYRLDSLFDIKKGKRLTKAHSKPGTTPFIGAIDHHNGVTAYISRPPIHKGNTITVVYNGNGVGEAFYQPVPFWCSDDVNVLYPLFSLTPAIALFIAAVIRVERFRFTYGRKWHLERMQSTKIKLPTLNGSPDWEFMDRYMKLLSFSSQLQASTRVQTAASGNS